MGELQMLQFRQMLSVVTRLGGLGEVIVGLAGLTYNDSGAPDHCRGPV
jgi:hypothetical protein